MRIAAAALTASATVVALGGCVHADDTATDRGQRETKLEIVFEKTAARDSKTFTLECDPARGDVPDPQAACIELREHLELVAPPSWMVCSIPGLVWTVRINGTLNGRRVITHFEPCPREGRRRLQRWMELTGFEPR